MNDRFVLCMPAGGLNDVLCQIEKCWRYAERHGRQLVIDTANTGLLDSFDQYFKVARPYCGDVHTRLSSETANRLATLSCKPRSLRGRLLTLAPVYNEEVLNFVDCDSGEALTFDFEKDWTEQLLVHCQCEGGKLGIACLGRLSLQPSISTTVLNRISLLPSDYIGVHVRNTDMQTAYKPFFESLLPVMKGVNILICSDDRNCIDFCKQFFMESNVYSVSEIPYLKDGQRLHETQAVDRFKANLDTIVDLFALSGAKRVLYTHPRTHNVKGFSGFSGLADMLQQHPRLRSNLLFGPS